MVLRPLITAVWCKSRIVLLVYCQPEEATGDLRVALYSTMSPIECLTCVCWWRAIRNVVISLNVYSWWASKTSVVSCCVVLSAVARPPNLRRPCMAAVALTSSLATLAVWRLLDKCITPDIELTLACTYTHSVGTHIRTCLLAHAYIP